LIDFYLQTIGSVSIVKDWEHHVHFYM